MGQRGSNRTMMELLAMGDYGVYVWPAYGITLFILGLNMFLAIREKNKTHHFIKQMITNSNES